MTPDACYPLFPVYLGDFVGSSLMIYFTVVAFIYALRLIRLEPQNVLWTYLFWLCIALTALAVSRSVGHLLRYIFILSGFPGVWKYLAPYSGGFNSLAFCAVGVLTFYYYNMRTVIERIHEDARALSLANRQLQNAQTALRHLNQSLEERVEQRTQALRVSEGKFRGLFEGSKDMIFFCDADGNICDINQCGLDLLGVRRRNIIGRPLADFFLDKGKWNKYCELLDTKGSVQDFEVQLIGKQGNHLYMMLTASAIKGKSGSRQGCEGIAKDITHFKKMTEQLVQSEKMTSVGQLAAGVAHEINTPLGIILGYTQLLEEDFEKQPDVYELLKTIEKNTKICRRIVADLLKFSRHSNEQKSLPNNINKCVEEVLSIVEHTLNMDRIFLYRSLAESLPDTSFDNERMRQVFFNLITNAHHAIGKEGIIGVWTKFFKETNEIEIIIGDSGSGIPPELLGRIFDPFFTTKGVGKGTGLGLSVSFGIVNDHGGRIEVQSPPVEEELTASGLHTAFFIYLPATQAEMGQEE